MRIGLLAFVAACGSHVGSGVASAPAGDPASASPVFLAGCPSGARPQSELDSAGLPPLVPTSGLLRCLLSAVSAASSYDGSYSFAIELTDGRVLQGYERRVARPAKDGASPQLGTGQREVNGVKWEWAALTSRTTVLGATTGGVYVELALAGDVSQLDTLVEVARSLRPVEALPRPSAQDLCASLPIGSPSYALAAAFGSSAGSVVKWHETPLSPDGPRAISQWRDHQATEPVAVCYIDGYFGLAKGGPPGAGAAPTQLRNWERAVYLVGVDRRPIGVAFGWKDGIPIRDPGP